MVVENPNLDCVFSTVGTCSSDAECKSEEKCCTRQCGGPACVAACHTGDRECPEVLPPPGCYAAEQLDEKNCPLCPTVVCPKHGTCPAPPAPPPDAGVGSVQHLCRFDTQCPGTQKCCSDTRGGLRCVEPHHGDAVCPVASGVPCGATTGRCTSDAQCAGSSKCCADSCNVRRCRNTCPALECAQPPVPLGPGCRLVPAAPDASGCLTQCPRVECLRDCNASMPCEEGSACFESRRCGQLSDGWGCGVQHGDFKCHPTCLRDSDCPYATPQCNDVVLWSQDAAVRRRMCHKCPVPDCPVAELRPGCKIVAAFGYNGCRQCDRLVCDNREACTPPVCTEPAPTFSPPYCYWNTKRRDDRNCPACPRVSCLADCKEEVFVFVFSF